MKSIKPTFQVYKCTSEVEYEDTKCKVIEKDLSHTMHCGRRSKR
jgi:hypothetical protein